MREGETHNSGRGPYISQGIHFVERLPISTCLDVCRIKVLILHVAPRCARFRHTCKICLTISDSFRGSEYMETTFLSALECLIDMLNGHCFVGQW